ncbi:regulatory protein GemA [Kaustia mangrovi]|uniref:Regulatory protein GemA n=1 Tax=Kaustia mangrovi TaxID=2593653 RepID=A0A7S8C732_9HYPH|nr:regulatory protein GemA [Kaustia mangrovi]QPC44606.1 regulatory protein GemA [Kaustia mangrovi]
MTATVTKAQIGAIHALKARAGLDEEAYRDMLETRTGKRSSTALSRAEAIAVIDHLKLVSNRPGHGVEAAPKPARGAQALDGPYAGVCRALWISAWNLGLVRDRTDRALVSFVRRQTGIDHLNWVRDPMDARQAIEALKSWIAREANVVWDLPAAERRSLGLSPARWRKIAVVDAQRRRLHVLGRPADLPQSFHDLSDTELDDLASELGRAIRRSARQGSA